MILQGGIPHRNFKYISLMGGERLPAFSVGGIPHLEILKYISLMGGRKTPSAFFSGGYPPVYIESPIMNSEGRRRLWMGFFPPADS